MPRQRHESAAHEHAERAATLLGGERERQHQQRQQRHDQSAGDAAVNLDLDLSARVVPDARRELGKRQLLGSQPRSQPSSRNRSDWRKAMLPKSRL